MTLNLFLTLLNKAGFNNKCTSQSMRAYSALIWIKQNFGPLTPFAKEKRFLFDFLAVHRAVELLEKINFLKIIVDNLNKIN